MTIVTSPSKWQTSPSKWQSRADAGKEPRRESPSEVVRKTHNNLLALIKMIGHLRETKAAQIKSNPPGSTANGINMKTIGVCEQASGVLTEPLQKIEEKLEKPPILAVTNAQKTSPTPKPLSAAIDAQGTSPSQKLSR